MEKYFVQNKAKTNNSSKVTAAYLSHKFKNNDQYANYNKKQLLMLVV